MNVSSRLPLLPTEYYKPQKIISLQVDGQIVTIEIPDSITKQFESRDEWKQFHEGFLRRFPGVKSFKGTANANKKGGHSQPTGPLPPKKRRLAEDLSGSIVDAAQVTPAHDDQVLVEVPIVNARAGKKLATMPLLRITKNMGPYILNEAGQDVPWLSNIIY